MIEAKPNGIAASFHYLGWKQIFGITLHIHAWEPIEVYFSIHILGLGVTFIGKALGVEMSPPPEPTP